MSSFQVEMGRGAVADGSDGWAWVYDEENKRRRGVSGDPLEDGPGFWELYRQDYKLARGLGCIAFAHANLEWSSGYKVQFGLCSVDAVTKRRTLKASAVVFKRIAEANMLP